MATLIFIVLFLITGSLFSAQANLRITEIYPAPTAEETEWVELYNDSDAEIDASQLSITDAKQNKMQLPATNILPHQYITATSSGVLNNSGGDGVTITGSDGAIVDSTNYTMDFSSEKSYALCMDNEIKWVVTEQISRLGPNDQACVAPTLTPTATLAPTPIATLSPTPTPTLTPTKTYTPTPTFTQPRSYSNIYINEVMAYPEGTNNEWVELYNNNDFAVELIDWFIDDVESAGARPRSMSVVIGSRSYAIIEVPTALFNNDGDYVRLLDFDNRLIDSVSYSESTQGKSWGKRKYNESELCIQTPSRNTTNSPCIVVQNPTTTPTQQPTSINSIDIIPSRPVIAELKLFTNSDSITDNESTESANITVPEWFFYPQMPTPKLVPTTASQAGQVLGADDAKSPIPILPLTGAASSVLTIFSLIYKIKQGAASEH